jgi:protocatechuate 3,4-dioxygenase, alpha subunit
MTDARLNETSSQTAGPYVHIGLTPDRVGIHVYEKKTFGNMLATDTPGERIRIEGLIIDGAGAVVKDGVVELWQADALGRHANGDAAAHFRGWARSITDLETGLFSFDTIKPGHVAGTAPHISLWIVARGINIGLHTRMYFSDEAAANATDPVLKLIDSQARRSTLIGHRAERHGLAALYTFDIRLQGERETVFFDL